MVSKNKAKPICFSLVLLLTWVEMMYDLMGFCNNYEPLRLTHWQKMVWFFTQAYANAANLLRQPGPVCISGQ